MSLQIKKYHDCPSIRPAMVVGLKSREVVSGVWPFRKHQTVLDNIYSDETARWTCPECGSVWNYRGGFEGRAGLWFAEYRKSWWEDANG